MGKRLADEIFESISESEHVLFTVQDALSAASVDPRRHRILWADGACLSIEDTAHRIHLQSGAPLDMVQHHVVGWLQMMYEPKDLDEEQMEEFERLIEEWVEPYEK